MSGVTTAGLDKYGSKLNLNGNRWEQELGRSALVAGTSARLEDKWFGGAKPDYAAVANSVIAQFAGGRVRGAISNHYGVDAAGQPLRSQAAQVGVSIDAF